MQHKTKTDKILQSLISLGFVLWLGISLARTFIAYDLVRPGEDVLLNSSYSVDAAFQTVYIYSMLSVYSGIGFGVAVICAVVLFAVRRTDLRNKGWLFMAFVLFFLCVPSEAVLIYYDIQLGFAIFRDMIKDINHPALQEYFVGRLTNPLVSVPSGLSFLSGLTALLFVIWKPLNNTGND